MQNHDFFEVTDSHLKLLKNTYVSWDNCEFGAPAIDCKRPYGNSSVYKDIAKILNIEYNDNDEFSDRDIAFMNKIHKETQTALQIFLKTGIMETGCFVTPKYQNKWIKIS